MDELEFVEKTLVDCAKRMPLDQAAAQLVQFGPDRKELVERALARIKTAAEKVRTLKQPRSFGQGIEPWYVGPTENDVMWPTYRKVLVEGGWSENDIEAVDSASSKILSFLQPPGAGVIDTRGLVIGYVQSGKTSNYTALIAKASDVGYRFFIILTGIIEALRQQTQERLESDLINRQPAHWVQLTRWQSDFDQHVNVNAFLADHANRYTVAVVKKNGPVLRRLLSWVRGAREEILRGCPVLVIDDEADLASINTSKGDIRTPINRLILETLSVLPKAAYVGFTATPFANVLIDPRDRDLYPKDFIIDLPRPPAYFGPERLFGRDRVTPEEPDQAIDGLDMIRTVYDREIPSLKPAGPAERYSFAPQVVPTLRRACAYFWMATAARKVRGQTNEHSTMLIHTSMYASVHEALRQPVESVKACTMTALATTDKSYLRKLRRHWESEQRRVGPQEKNETSVPFEALLEHLPSVIQHTEFKVENSISATRLDYRTPGRIYIVVGGNVLSRGLTLHGLVVSYFVRTASAYDTLLQMGRWFGFRRGYSDLPRVWMTDDLKGYFYDLATVEREIRNDIEVYEKEKVTPLQFAVRIREHPGLSITSPMKMRNAMDAIVSYSAQRPQTFLFRHRDLQWLRNNIEATRNLISGIRAVNITGKPVSAGSFVFHGVSNQLILGFLGAYKFHENNRTLRSTLIINYIRAQSSLPKPELLTWNVGIISPRAGTIGDIDLGGERRFNLMNRSRLKLGRSDLSTADLKSVMSNSDIVLDIRDERVDLKLGAAQLVAHRTTRVPGVGLLLIYPISKDSRPESGKDEERTALDAAEDVIGVALVFPKSGSDTPQSYKSAKIPETQEIEEIENVEEVAGI